MSTLLGAEDVLRDRLAGYRKVAGGQAEGLCPFHVEKRPSFRVNVNAGSSHYLRWDCKGCGKKGGGRDLLLHLLGADAASMVDGLLPRYPVKEGHVAFQKHAEQLPLPESVLHLYTGWVLRGLLEVGFTQETLDLYEVGYDPVLDAWTYPIRNHYGVLTGIYRRMHTGNAKYLPYGPRDFPEGLVDANYQFRKSLHLWGLDKELSRTRDVNGPAVLVEGQKACMWVRQHLGSKVLVVAGMGTSVSRRQAELLGWLGRTVLILYDNTVSAKRLALDAAKRIRAAGCPARAVTEYVVDVPQPDDLTEEQLEQTLWAF